MGYDFTTLFLFLKKQLQQERSPLSLYQHYCEPEVVCQVVSRFHT